MKETVSLEVAIEEVLRNGPNFELLAGLCKMAAEAEREACAKVCVKIALEFKSMYCGDEMEAALICEKTIRARGNT